MIVCDVCRELKPEGDRHCKEYILILKPNDGAGRPAHEGVLGTYEVCDSCLKDLLYVITQAVDSLVNFV